MTCHIHHAQLCPVVLNREKQLSIAIGALRQANTTETVQALKSIQVIAGLQEKALCDQCGKESDK